jgi:O-antigen ligase
VSTGKNRLSFDLSDLGFLYGTLFALSLVIINPQGVPYGGIWTTPKVYLVISLALLTWGVLLAQVALLLWRRARGGDGSGGVKLPARWGVAAVLWLAFLASGMVTIYLSPVTFRSALIANAEMGDGWVYWAWMAALVCGNALLLRCFPRLFKAQLYGLLIGGLLSAGAVFAQSVNWTLDFTDTTGQTFSGFAQLRSGIFKGWMPIGFTSNRGHVGFILAALTVLVLVCLVRGWLKGRTVWPLYTVFLAALYLTSSRGPQLAFAAGMLYLLVRFWRVPGGRKVMLIAFAPVLLGGALLLSGVLGTAQTRNLPPLSAIISNPFGFTSARTDLWASAADGIRARPLFGWGFNGFGLAWPHVNDFDVHWKTYLARDEKNRAIGVARILRNNHASFEYLGEDGNVYRVANLTNKAHNIVLDTAVSLGLVGASLYALLFGFFVYITARGAGWGLEVLGIVYLVFGLTWFESAQYSHLVWWALSVGLAFYALPQAVSARESGSKRVAVVVTPNS